MRLAELVRTSEQVAATSGRREKIRLLAELLAALPAEELALGVAYLTGELPQGKIGISYATVHALQAPAAKEPSLSLLDIATRFAQIASARGSGSSAARKRELVALWELATEAEQSFLGRLLVGELRQGALEGVMLDAIAQAFAVPVDAVRRAAMLGGQLPRVAELAKSGGEAQLREQRLQLLVPLAPMLAQSAESAAEALGQLGGPAAFERKLDGARVQVHRAGDDVRVFTRQLNDVTAAVPELVEVIRALPVTSIVLDGEAIVLRKDGKPVPFQITMKRFGRRLDVERLRAELPLRGFFFDVLHLDGEDVFDRPASERAQLIAQSLPPELRVERIETDDPEQAEAFLQQALDAGHEGVVAKSLAAPYEAGRRGGAWIKIKRAHTLDLVVLAVEWGSGRRRGLLSNLHLGARGPDGTFVMLGKTFKGMSDEMLRFQTEALQKLETHRDAYTVYVRPELVVEIAFDGVQRSSHYPGGVALRFARVKGYRPDKRASEADTIETVLGYLDD